MALQNWVVDGNAEEGIQHMETQIKFLAACLKTGQILAADHPDCQMSVDGSGANQACQNLGEVGCYLVGAPMDERKVVALAV